MTIDKFLHRLYFCKLWGTFLEDLLYLKNNSNELKLINLIGYNLRHFADPLTYSMTLLDSLDDKFGDIYDELKLNMMTIESRLTSKKTKRPFTKFKNLFKNQNRLLRTISLFILLFVFV